MDRSATLSKEWVSLPGIDKKADPHLARDGGGGELSLTAHIWILMEIISKKFKKINFPNV